MNIVDVLLAQQLGGGGSGGGITPEQLATYVKNNTIKKVIETPVTDNYEAGDLIFDLSDAQIKICASGQGGKSWSNVTQAWLNTFKQDVLDQLYQPKITAGAGLVFDGNTLKHSNSVTPKPQRFIRATAYDAQGHAINFGVDYLVSRSDYNDDAVSDLYLSSSLWVHTHHSPIEASSFASEVNNSISANDCVFNMMDIGGATRTRRSQKRYMGLASITDPISNTALYGGIDVTEYWYAYLQEGVGTCKIEQVFKNSYNGDNGIVFKRYGSLAFSDAGEFGTAIYTNRSSIVWGDWIPVEYPKTNLTLSNTTDFFVDTFCFSVSGGNVTIFISGLRKLVESPSSNTFATIPSCLKSANGSGGHSMLIDSNTFNTFATLSKIDPSNSLLLRGAVTTAKYYGILVYGL